MNRTIIGFLLVLLLANCQRNEPQMLNEPSLLNEPEKVVGTWRWEASSGGLGGGTHKPRTGENTYLTFLNNQTFEVTRNDTLFVKGRYQVIKTQSIYSGEDAPAVQLTEMVRPRQITNPNFSFFHLVGDLMIIQELTSSRLSVGDNAYDGYGSSFTRK